MKGQTATLKYILRSLTTPLQTVLTFALQLQMDWNLFC